MSRAVGEFHMGDSYIALNTYKDPTGVSEALFFDVHFWIGSESTQDEYGVAAYKTVGGNRTLHDASCVYTFDLKQLMGIRGCF